MATALIILLGIIAVSTWNMAGALHRIAEHNQKFIPEDPGTPEPEAEPEAES